MNAINIKNNNKNKVIYKRTVIYLNNRNKKTAYSKVCRLLSNFLVHFAIYAAERLTLSRNSLPGLKCGTYFPLNSTDSPVLGFLPTRGAR